MKLQGRQEPSVSVAEPLLLRRALVAQPLRHCDGLVTPVPRAPRGRLPQQRGHAQRPRRRMPRVEHEIQKDDARVHLPLSIAGHVNYLRQVSPEPHTRWHLLRPSRALGQQGTKEDTHSTYPLISDCAHC